MSGCKIDFTRESGQYALEMYQALLQEGVSCQDLDVGVSTINYAGIHCPSKDDKACVKGKGDGTVQAEEVLEYTLDRYEKYQKLIEGVIQRPLPWVLDDLNPETTFDAEIRQKVNAAITELDGILRSEGLVKGTDAYNERMAVGLFWFATLPPKEKYNESVRQKVISKLKKDNHEKFLAYIEKNGGLRTDLDYSEEYAALESLKFGKGKCTETSKVLFAVLKMAGLKPVFIYENIMKEEIDDPDTNKTVKSFPPNMLHMSVGLFANQHFRLFDSSLVDSNASYKYFYPLSLRQSLSLDYSNLGALFEEKKPDRAIADYSKAIKIDSNNTLAYSGRGGVTYKKGESDKAIADYSKAIEINPTYADAYYNRGVIYGHKGEPDKEMGDYSRAIALNPMHTEAYVNRGIVYAMKDEFDKAITDFSTAIEINPKDAKAYRGLATCHALMGEKFTENGKKSETVEEYKKALEFGEKALEFGFPMPEGFEVEFQGRIQKIEAETGLDQKLTALNAAAKKTPEVAKAYFELAEAYYMKNQLAKAAECYQHAVNIQPKSAPALLGLWNTYKALGDVANAEKACKKYKKTTGESVSCE